MKSALRWFSQILVMVTGLAAQSGLAQEPWKGMARFVPDVKLIEFRARVSSFYANTSTTNGWFEVQSGKPAEQTVLVDTTDFNAATWSAYSSNFVFDLGNTEGWHEVVVGLREAAPQAFAAWRQFRVKLDRTPPVLVITNLPDETVSTPLIQIQGYCPEELSAISYDLTNASGLLTNQSAFVVDQYHDTKTWEFTTNTFQAFDVELANGLNLLTFYATDRTGNRTQFNRQLTLVADEKPPVVSLIWPEEGGLISSDTFTIRGWVDDMSVQIQAAIHNTNDITHFARGFTERDGKMWVENLPLGDGTNWVMLTVTDVWSNSVATNFTVVKSPVRLTIDPVDPQLLHRSQVTVTGTIDTPGYTVSVNGVMAIVKDGVWRAEGVPVNEGNTANFRASAIAIEGPANGSPTNTGASAGAKATVK